MKIVSGLLFLGLVLGFAGSASATDAWELQAPYQLSVKKQDSGSVEYCQATVSGQDSNGTWLVEGVSNTAVDTETCTMLMQDGNSSCEIDVVDPPFTFLNAQMTTISDYCNQYRIDHSSNWKAQIYVFKVVKNN